jgi:hypothetical protein
LKYGNLGPFFPKKDPLDNLQSKLFLFAKWQKFATKKNPVSLVLSFPLTLSFFSSFLHPEIVIKINVLGLLAVGSFVWKKNNLHTSGWYSFHQSCFTSFTSFFVSLVLSI